MIRLALFLVLLASPCLAVGGGTKLMFSRLAVVPDWPAANAINGITSISNSGTTDTGAQTGRTGAGTVTAHMECTASGSYISDVSLFVDGVLQDYVGCSSGLPSFSRNLTYAVSAGVHTIQISGSATGTATFLSNAFSIPMP